MVVSPMSNMLHEHRRLMQAFCQVGSNNVLISDELGAGVAVGLKNWLRITFSIEPQSLEQGLDRMKAFCQRHSRK
jgi:hypothetical protein